MALHGLWGSFFSRAGGGEAMRRPPRFWSRIELVVAPPVPPARRDGRRAARASGRAARRLALRRLDGSPALGIVIGFILGAWVLSGITGAWRAPSWDSSSRWPCSSRSQARQDAARGRQLPPFGGGSKTKPRNVWRRSETRLTALEPSWRRCRRTRRRHRTAVAVTLPITQYRARGNANRIRRAATPPKSPQPWAEPTSIAANPRFEG